MAFKIQLPAKCILGGEYTILNKGIGIVCPFYKYHLTLEYQPDTMQTCHTITGEAFNSIQIIMWGVIVSALNALGKNPRDLKGHFVIDCTIPPCSGLGFSAALCAAVCEWLISANLLARKELLPFAQRLEDSFHLKSSGIDLIGVMAKKMVSYSSERTVSEIALGWKPQLYVSNSGQRSITRDCMEHINAQRATSPEKIARIEEQMMAATFLIKEALESDTEDRLALLAKGLNLANECYYAWGLVSNKLNDHLTEVKQYALACKIIGAGFGGHVLSLWKETPPSSLPFKLYPLLS
ncbi:MAG: mevalonate kinase [Tatlockia sp.]|jgi:mevalonate kinase